LRAPRTHPARKGATRPRRTACRSREHAARARRRVQLRRPLDVECGSGEGSDEGGESPRRRQHGRGAASTPRAPGSSARQASVRHTARHAPLRARRGAWEIGETAGRACQAQSSRAAAAARRQERRPPQRQRDFETRAGARRASGSGAVGHGTRRRMPPRASIRDQRCGPHRRSRGHSRVDCNFRSWKRSMKAIGRCVSQLEVPNALDGPTHLSGGLACRERETRNAQGLAARTSCSHARLRDPLGLGRPA
jgi:hypothetical protein